MSKRRDVLRAPPSARPHRPRCCNITSLGGIGTARLTTANNLLGPLGGIVTAGTQGFNVTSPTSVFVPGASTFSPWRYENHSLYFQDRWRLRPEMSLTLGLRYELFPALRIANNVGIEPLIPEGTHPLRAILNPQGRYTTLAQRVPVQRRPARHEPRLRGHHRHDVRGSGLLQQPAGQRRQPRPRDCQRPLVPQRRCFSRQEHQEH